MTTFLYSALLTAGADKMAVSDPHGWTLTLISVSVVFSALIILYFLYSLSGALFSGKFKSSKPKKAKAPKGAPSDEEAAAIALALDAELGGADEVAIALALHLYLGETVHDVEPGFITIKKSRGAWNNKKW